MEKNHDRRQLLSRSKRPAFDMTTIDHLYNRQFLDFKQKVWLNSKWIFGTNSY